MPIPIATSARAPTLQGTLSHTPSETLARVAEKTGVPASSLATLSVQHNSPTLYVAVLEYAALCTPPDPDKHHPLFVNSFDDRHDSSDDEDDAIANAGLGSVSRRSMDRAFARLARYVPSGGSLPLAGKGLRGRRVPVPKFKFALGETAVVWPPPPHLTAEHLVAERDRARNARRAAAKAAENKVADLSATLDGTPNAVPNDIPSKDVVFEDGDGTKPDKPADPQSTIYISHYSVGDPQPADNGGLVTYREILMVSADGPAALKKFATDVIRWQADKDHREGDGTKFALHRFKTGRFGGAWEHEGMKHARPPSSVILPQGQMNAILSDVRKFLNPDTKKWYVAHGLPHRRSYLFYGHPGTGKTSTIRAIASTFRLNCCYLSMTTASFSNQALGDALSQIPSNALIVLEDVDSLFNEDRKPEQGGSLTFSGLLNALDGLISAEGVITVMTTNHIDRLDKALIRGGRVDRRFLFRQPTQEQMENLFRSFYPGASSVIVRKFSDAVLSRPEGDEARSIATLQQLFIDQRESSAEDCVEAVPRFFEAHFPDGTVGKKASFYS